MKRVRLRPGGKLLLVLAGVGVLGYGAHLAGLSEPVIEWVRRARGGATDPAPPQAPPPAPTAAPTAAPAPHAPPDAEAPQTPPDAADPQTPPAVAAPDVGSDPAQPPPLSGVRSEPIVGWDDIREGDWSDTDELLRQLRDAERDLLPLDLHEVVQAGAAARGLVVVGAIAPSKNLLLCADGSPLDVVRAGAVLRSSRKSERLLMAHVAEVKGVGATGVRYRDEGTADAWVTDSAPEGGRCLSLPRLGAQGPRLVLARARDARLYGESYRAAAAERGALEASARAYLGAPDSDLRGYPHHSRYLAALAGRIDGRPAVLPPSVARWIVLAAAPVEGEAEEARTP